jgi:hypothetical protein
MSAGDSAKNHLLSIDDLDQAIVNLSARINAETYQLLVLIRQFDERAGWLKWGLGNCAEWLHYRCDLSMNAAHCQSGQRSCAVIVCVKDNDVTC